MEKNTLVAGYRVAVGVLTVVALAVQLVTSYDLVPSFNPVNFFSYFTNLSNIIGAGVFLFCGGYWFATRHRQPHGADLVRGLAVVCLVITWAVYNLLLVDEPLGALQPWVNVVVHQIMPIAVFVDWLLDPPVRRLRFGQTAWWLAFPVLYITYTMIRGPVADWYPYPFLNPANVGGYGGVAPYAVAIAVGFVLVVLAVTALGNRFGRARTELGAATMAG